MIEIADAKPIHVGMIARRLRSEDRAEIEALYGDCRKAIRRVFRGSPYRKAAFVEGEIGALWGFWGTLLSSEVYGWLVTTPAIERVPLGFFREVRREIRQMLEMGRVVRGTVAADYHRAVRFMEMAGFRAGEPERLGLHGVSFRQLEAR